MSKTPMNLVHDLITSRSLNRWLPWIAGLVLAIGVIAFVAVKWNNTAKSLDTPVSNQKASTPGPQPKAVRLDPQARSVAAQFIANAVSLDFRNKDGMKPTAADKAKLAQAWKITAGPLKEGTAYKDWLAGNMAVVPYPARPHAGLQIEYSYKNSAELIFALLPKKGFKIKGQYFLMDLARTGAAGHKHWVVTYWVPKSPPVLPIGPDS